MIKLIYSSAFDTTVDVGMRLIEDPRQLSKSASTVFDCDYEQIKPDKDHLGIHLVALGDFEHYGINRNGDGFPKAACIKYHDTFVKNGCLYRHHRNKDREARLGQVVKSAYNEPMGRIELFIHAHKEKARDELQKLATDGDIPFSMACKVAFDRCTICNTIRKSSKDPDQCEHVLMNLGKVANDGKVVGTQNDEPNFFDISFVTRPADRIAWHLKAASNEIIDSVKLAEAEDIWVPYHIAIVSAEAQAKLELLKKLAEEELHFKGRILGWRGDSPSQRYDWELRKAASTPMDDKLIEELRKYEPKDVFYKLASKGIIMDVRSFFKYAMGLDFGDIAGYMDQVQGRVGDVYTRIVESGRCQEVCNDCLFDVDSSTGNSAVPVITKKIAEELTLVGPCMEQRVIDTTIKQGEATEFHMKLDTKHEIESNATLTIDALAEKYAAYKLAAIQAVQSFNKNTDTNALIAIAAAQNLVTN